ncbi:MAG: Rrf2 family transcriptional regulator [Gemmatimonadales bacterium]|nr:MAG: Rrf2 family transcriptional regulator [Gemmatimonadales bacterium]
MLYSKTCERAIRALAYLAARPVGDLCLVDEIAEAEEMPRPFTSKILRDLVKAGLLTSSRGPGGGYALARDPEEVPLLEIQRIMDGAGNLDRCAVGLAACNEFAPCPLHDQFMPLRKAIRAYLEETTLAEMAGALKRKRALLAEES